MLRTLEPPLVPRDGHTLKVVLPTRVSDPGEGKQSVSSPDDQDHMLREALARLYDGPTDARSLRSEGAGEFLERVEFLELLNMVESERIDLVLAEDLGRILRRLYAHTFVETCVDHGVRVITLGDNIDTAVPGWEDKSIFAAWHHERSNRDHAERVKRGLRGKFDREGGGGGSGRIYGIVVPPGSNDTEWSQLPEARDVYTEWFERLDGGQSFAEIADWLNAMGVPTGPRAIRKLWDGTMVGRVTRNPILKGRRFKNKRQSRRNAKGRYKPVPMDPSDTRWRHVPHLAFIDEAEYDRILEKVEADNAPYSSGTSRSRQRTRFPGRSLYCGICGRLFVFGGHGQRDRLMCQGAREYRCWNGVTIDGPLAAARISAAIFAEIQAIPEIDDDLLAEVNREADRLDSDREVQLVRLDREIAGLQRDYESLLTFTATARLRARQDELEASLDALDSARRVLTLAPSYRIEIPSIEEVREIARAELRAFAVEDPGFVRFVHVVAPRIVVFPYRLCDGGRVEHRARFRLHLARLLPDEQCRNAVDGVLESEVEVDLFDPPQRESHRERIVRLRAEGWTEREAAKTCGITTTAAQRGAALQRRMQDLGLDDPWIRVNTPPGDLTKLRRHLHDRYRFDPLDNAGCP